MERESLEALNLEKWAPSLKFKPNQKNTMKIQGKKMRCKRRKRGNDIDWITDGVGGKKVVLLPGPNSDILGSFPACAKAIKPSA